MSKVTGSYELNIDNGVIHLIITNSSTLSYEDIIEIEFYVKSKSNKKRHPRLVDIRSYCEIDSKAKIYLMGQKPKYRINAQAILVGSSTSQDLLDFFTEMGSKKLPTRIFVSIDEAYKWLRTYRER